MQEERRGAEGAPTHPSPPPPGPPPRLPQNYIARLHEVQFIASYSSPRASSPRAPPTFEMLSPPLLKWDLLYISAHGSAVHTHTHARTHAHTHTHTHTNTHTHTHTQATAAGNSHFLGAAFRDRKLSESSRFCNNITHDTE